MDSVQPFVFLRDHLAACDAIVVDVIEVVSQIVKCRPRVIYSSRFGSAEGYMAPVLEFVGSAPSWGNVVLKAGERALVFVSAQASGRLYQRYWCGHLSLVELRGELHAVAHWNILNGEKQWEPLELYRAAFRPDVSKPGEVALPWKDLEQHLEREIAIRDKG